MLFEPITGNSLTNNRTRLFITLIVAFLIVVINGLLDHYFAPKGITNTAFILPLATSIICYGMKHVNPIWVSIVSFVCVAVNDILIKLYGGGLHDNEGLGWNNLFLFIGVLISFGILIVYVVLRKQYLWINRAIAIISFPILIYVYFLFFEHVGLGRYYP